MGFVYNLFCIDDNSLVSRYLDEQEGFNNVSLGTWMNWKDMIINYISLGTWMKRKDIIINFISLGTWTSRKGRKGLFLSGFSPAWIQPYQSSSFMNMPQVVSVSEKGGLLSFITLCTLYTYYYYYFKNWRVLTKIGKYCQQKNQL